MALIVILLACALLFGVGLSYAAFWVLALQAELDEPPADVELAKPRSRFLVLLRLDRTLRITGPRPKRVYRPGYLQRRRSL